MVAHKTRQTRNNVSEKNQITCIYQARFWVHEEWDAMCFSITTPGCGDSLDKAGQYTRCLTESVMEHLWMTRIVVLGCGGGGWSGVDLVIWWWRARGGGAEGGTGMQRDSERVQKTLVMWVFQTAPERCTGLVTPQHKHGPVWVKMSYFSTSPCVI